MDKNVGLYQNALENVGPPATAWKGRSGWSVFIFCIPVLDNPHTTVLNKDKERRWLHSGQLPLSVSHFEKHDRRSLEDYRGGHFFLCFFLCTLVLDNPRTAVYNKNKERRYACKRLAPHQSSITKVMTATGLGVLGGHFFLCFFLLLP